VKTSLTPILTKEKYLEEMKTQCFFPLRRELWRGVSQRRKFSLVSPFSSKKTFRGRKQPPALPFDPPRKPPPQELGGFRLLELLQRRGSGESL